ncbi:tetratricopeptide repeat domain-containing protein PYG7, chloroplastic [Tanacetum coccineum]
MSRYPSGHSAFVLWIMTISVQLQHNLSIRLLLLLRKSDRCFREYHKLILIVLSSGSIGTSFILKKKGLKKASTTTSFGDGEMELRSHLSTIRTVHAWETKLYDEVNVHIRSIDNNGVNCVRDNEIDKGISPLESAAKIQPWYVTAWNSLGKAYAKKYKCKSALRIFEETLLFNPNNKLTRTRRDVLEDKVQLNKGISNKVPISSDTKILGQSNGNKKKDIVMEKQATTEAEIGCHIDGVAVVSQQVVPPYGEPNN